MINIKPKHLEIVLGIIGKYNYNFYAFGSRITDKIKKFSDLDLFYTEDIPEKIITNSRPTFFLIVTQINNFTSVGTMLLRYKARS